MRCSVLDMCPRIEQPGHRMRQSAVWRLGSDLKEIAREASQALAHLEGERLEELVVACRTLNCDEYRKALTKDGMDEETSSSFAVLGRMVELTKASLQVLYRTRAGRMEYGLSRGRES